MIIAGTFFFSRQSPRGTVNYVHANLVFRTNKKAYYLKSLSNMIKIILNHYKIQAVHSISKLVLVNLPQFDCSFNIRLFAIKFLPSRALPGPAGLVGSIRMRKSVLKAAAEAAAAGIKGRPL